MTPLAIVAGAGPGVGMAVARRFAREGFALGLIGRSEAPLIAAGASLGVPVAAAAADLAQPDGAARAIGTITEALGQPGVLVYNASAFMRMAPVMDLPVADFMADVAVSLTGAFAAAKAVYPAMRSSGGCMLFTGGGLALAPQFGTGAVSLTAGKSGLRGFVHALAEELRPDGIHVATVTIAGTVAPGTAFDPDLIAQRFWEVFSEPRESWSVESVFGR
jgi:NAD(P)-dependent dehydrogenase (short-subunit alcohol dehydrogenase family)